MKYSMYIIVLSMLVGCVTPVKLEDYNRGTASVDEFERESADCEMKAEQSRTNHGYGGWGGALHMTESFNKVFDACMRSKGYKKNPVERGFLD